MSGCSAPGVVLPRRLSNPAQRPTRLLPARLRCNCLKRVVKGERRDSRHTDQLRPRQPAAGLPRVISGCTAATVSLFVPLLPSWASEFLDDAYIDPSLAESPDILGTLLIVVITYFIVMMLYLWLSSFLDEDVSTHNSGSSSSDKASSDRSELPPSYGSFLDAHVRSYVDPHGGGSSHRVRALAALDDVTAPLEGENLQQLKERLAAAAVEALDQQIRDAERLVRTKLLARKLGYTHANAKLGTPSSSRSSITNAELTSANIGDLLTAAALTTPGGLNSCQYKAALDALIDKELEKQLPPGGGAWHDDLVARAVMRRVVGALVMEESLLLLEGVHQGKTALEAAGRDKSSSKKWALW